jgi:NarL family two-component system response regulator LiaR
MGSLVLKVVVVDDHDLFREMLKERLGLVAGVTVVGDYSGAAEMMAHFDKLSPDILILDIDMPGLSVFEAVRQLQNRGFTFRVLFLSAFLRDSYIEQALEVGASAYVVKSQSFENLVEGIRSVSAGRHYFSPEVQARLVISSGGVSLSSGRQTRLHLLTEREVEVLRLLAQAHPKKSIARELDISIKTVDHHATNIMVKLDIHDRVELTRYAIREGLIAP